MELDLYNTTMLQRAVGQGADALHSNTSKRFPKRGYCIYLPSQTASYADFTSEKTSLRPLTMILVLKQYAVVSIQ